MYLKYMGAEAYGLVGFFAMIQAWFGLLDMGLTPTVARETARLNGGAVDALSYRRLLRALQIVFLSTAVLGCGVVIICSRAIAVNWLNVKALPTAQVQLALQLMAACMALRWMSGLYRGCITGAERLVWLGCFNSLVATLRFLGVLPVLIFVKPSPEVFFTYQLVVALVEFCGLACKAFNIFPSLPKSQKLGWSPKNLISPIKPILKFSLTIAFTSSVWVLVTQTDKLILSKILPLADYGYFTLAVLAASGVMMISGPISAALLPRMSRLHAEGAEDQLIRLYRKATQMVAVISIPACLVLSFFAEQVLWVWTGDALAAVQAAPVLRLYALGNGFLVLAAFPYYLQYAKGDLRLHFIGNLLFVFILIPSLIYATLYSGSTGAGYAWFGANALSFFAWVPLIHIRFLKGMHWHWLRYDVLAIGIPATVGATIFRSVVPWQHDRLQVGVGLLLVSSSLFFIASVGSSWVREKSLYLWRLYFIRHEY